MVIHAYTDGASRGNPGESGIGIILRDGKGSVLFAEGWYIGHATNNIAEYRALLACLKKAASLGCTKLIVHSDSELIVRQVQGKYRVKDKTLREHFREVHELLRKVPFEFTIEHVEREQNRDADKLANGAIDIRRELAD